MDLIKILSQDYIIIIFITIIITIITYFIIKNNDKKNKDKKNKDQKINYSKILLIVFISTFIILFLLKFLINYINKNNFFQKGGKINNELEELTIIADDIDYDIMEN